MAFCKPKKSTGQRHLILHANWQVKSMDIPKNVNRDISRPFSPPRNCAAGSKVAFDHPRAGRLAARSLGSCYGNASPTALALGDSTGLEKGILHGIVGFNIPAEHGLQACIPALFA